MGLFNKNLKEETINVEGMKCVHCAKKVTDALKTNKVKATVDLENKSVTVKYDETKINLETIKSIINELGFNCI